MPRYMSLVRIAEDEIPQELPERLMLDMGTLIEEMTKAGVLLDTAGLTPTKEGTRLHWRNRELSVTDGPFTETKEVVGGYAILQCKDRAEALEWTKRFLSIHGDIGVTSELREIVEG
ncbi:YciI family protein [Streptomyces sp. NPDC002004]